MGKITKQEKQDYREAKESGQLGPKGRIWPTKEQVKEIGRAARGR